MKFSEIKYERPDLDAVKQKMAQFIEKLEAADSFEAANTVFVKMDQEERHLETLANLASIRHTIDTRDVFYEQESDFWNDAGPELQEYSEKWTKVLLASPFREQFAEEYGEIIFSKAEMELKAFSPEIIADLQEEAKLAQTYEKLLASAQIPFEGNIYTISQITPFKSDENDARRLAAWKAEGQWYKDHQEELDDLYDKLVKLRNKMGCKMGYDGYTELGYYRMNRNSYTKEDVEQFRLAVQKYLVPLATEIHKQQAKRMGYDFPMSFADEALQFRSGNPCPQGTPDEILAAGKKFYEELSPETGEFFNKMMDGDLLDVLSKEGKRTGGYCTSLPDYGVPFIFANFNGTQHDVEVVTHEAGHAFAYYLNRNRVPDSTSWPSMEGCEVHSMSMEFMAWPWEKDFFGSDTEKFYYSHLTGAINFIPYGTMVDHFQHEVYEHPEMTPAERHGVWKHLLGVYMPWLKLDGEIPFFSEGEGWQRQHHIYSMPFYYIDYCLAQTVALQFWALLQNNQKAAWERYMTYTSLGGSDIFTNLLKKAGLENPFDESCLKMVCAQASKWLDAFDETKLS